MKKIMFFFLIRPPQHREKSVVTPDKLHTIAQYQVNPGRSGYTAVPKASYSRPALHLLRAGICSVRWIQASKTLVSQSYYHLLTQAAFSD